MNTTSKQTHAGQPVVDIGGEAMYWPAEQWRALQARQLAAHLAHARRSALYRRASLPAEIEIPAENLESVLRRLPLTTKDQLASAGLGALAVAPHQVREWVCTSGTSGRPLDVGLTERDLERLTINEAAALAVAGLSRGDRFVLAVGMERMFVAGLAYWLGARRLGAGCVRLGPQLAVQPTMMREILGRLGAAERVFVIAVPSFLLTAEPPATELSGIIAIGEPIRTAEGGFNALGRRLHERFRCPVMSTYALTETCTTFAEGAQCRGGHLNPALGIVEALDETGRPAAAGQVGEIVITPLGVEGMPLIRFRTGDMAALHTETCACGRTTPRVGPIVGRRQQLLKFRGTSVYPNAIVEALRAVEAVEDCVLVAEAEHELSDRLTVHVLLREDGTAVKRTVEGRLRGVLRVMPEIRYTDVEEIRHLQHSTDSRKAERFVDRRSHQRPMNAHPHRI